MSAPIDTLQANLFYRRKRRVDLLRAGGTFPAVADEIFRVPGSALAPITPLTAGHVTSNAMFVTKLTAYDEIRSEIFGTTSNKITFSITTAMLVSITAEGFGVIADLTPATTLNTGEHIFVVAMDIDNTRIAVLHSGVMLFNDTDAGFTSWGDAADTFEYGVDTDRVTHHSAEVYLDRLPPGM